MTSTTGTNSKKPLTDAQKRNRYVRGQVLPRSGGVFLSWRFAVPGLLGFALAFVLPRVCSIDAQIGGIASAGLNYSAISFGACITGAVLAIGLPSEERVSRWASAVPKGKDFSVYSDLVFALTWAAYSQLAVLVVSIAASVVGDDETILPDNPYPSHLLLLALSLWVFLYGVLQLLVLVSTISQLGNVIDSEQRGKTADHVSSPATSTADIGDH